MKLLVAKADGSQRLLRFATPAASQQLATPPPAASGVDETGGSRVGEDSIGVRAHQKQARISSHPGVCFFLVGLGFGKVAPFLASREAMCGSSGGRATVALPR
ncbi:hypothetical protein [Kribbella sp. NPDC051718]|uniref:hypothetical protein n=1 Tax=Kribbella sp. NPDC051718 TaxID=3155168 RepID=UPI003432A583